MNREERVYLDWAAATPLLPQAKAAMEPWLTDNFANPSAIHAEGQAARDAVEAARARIARSLQVRPETITFTGSGTEANNIAILGTVLAEVANGRQFGHMEVVTTRIEHPSIIETVRSLEQRGVVVRYVDVTEVGVMRIDELANALTEKTVLVATSYVNSEIGTIASLHKIKKTISAAESKFGNKILFHVDAAQAPLWLNCQFDATHADMLTLDTGKCCGPKGVGVLVCGKRAQPAPVVYGGGQENGLRPGTENVAGIVGAAEALVWAQAGWRERAENVVLVRDQAIEYMLKEIPKAVLNGLLTEDRIANNINISIPRMDTEFATVVLDAHGFAVSTKSACSGAGGGESVVVKAITNDPARAAATLRITLGPDTTYEQLKALTGVLKAHVQHMQSVDS